MKSTALVVCIMCGLGVAGCQLVQNLQTPDAALARRVISENCLVGKIHDGVSDGVASGSSMQIKPVRLGKVSKFGYYTLITQKSAMDPSRIFVFSIQELPEGWAVADAAYEGQRDNLYFNRHSGEFVCSMDEWRAVRASPNRFTFERSPLIVSTIPNTTQ